MGKIIAKTYTDFELPAGIEDENGKIHKDYDLVAITGVEEEAVGSSEVRNNAAKIIQILASSCCVRLGDYHKEDMKEKEWDRLIANLYIGDIDQMMMNLRKISHGEDDPITLQQVCPACHAPFNYEMKLDEFKIKPFLGQRILKVELEDGCVVEDKLETDMQLRLATNADRIILDSVSRNNLGLAFTRMVVRCTLNIGELPGNRVTENMIRRLSSKDRKKINDVFGENAFGIDPTTEIVCPQCNYTYTGTLNASSFF